MIKFFSFLLLGALIYAGPVAAEQSTIAAIVNNDTILASELDARIRLFLISAQMADKPENRKQIKDQMLKRMIDEKLKLQWTKKFDLKATNEEVEQSFAALAERNNMKPQQLEQYLKANRVPKELLLEHIKADIVWQTYIRERHQSSIQIPTKIIQSKLEEYKTSKSVEQAQLAEIVLFYDKGDDQDKATTEGYAQKLISEVKRGANFGMVAQQSSHSASAALGGDIGWVLISKLDNDSKQVIDKLQPGEVGIVKMQNGLRILMLRNKRVGGAANQVDTMLSFSQVVMPLPKNPTMEGLHNLYNQSSSICKNARNCDGLSKLAQSANKNSLIKMNDDIPASNLNPQLRDILMKMPINKASAPIRIEEGFLIFMVSKREKVSQTDPTEDDVYRGMLEQKLGQLSVRELRNLRRVAFIQIMV